MTAFTLNSITEKRCEVKMLIKLNISQLFILYPSLKCALRWQLSLPLFTSCSCLDFSPLLHCEIDVWTINHFNLFSSFACLLSSAQSAVSLKSPPTFHLPHPSFWQTGSQRLDDNSFFSTIFLQQTFNWIQRLAEALESAFVEAAVWSGVCVVTGGNHGSNHPQYRHQQFHVDVCHLLSMASNRHWKPAKAKSSQEQIWTLKPGSC